MTRNHQSACKKIRIISPAGVVSPQFLDGAVKVLTEWGYEVSEGKHARTVYGRFAGTISQRISDLQEAINDTSLTAVLCSRGGYGLVQLIDQIDFSVLQRFPKWFIGFSDITVIHQVLSNQNIPSIHGPMAADLSKMTDDALSLRYLRQMLQGGKPAYEWASDEFNRFGRASGKLIGGNLSVMMGLRGTLYDLNFENNILFIEEIGEVPYKIDRMLQNLKIGGVFDKIKGLVVGHFTNCEEDPLMQQSIREMLADAVSTYDFPICFGFPAGHEWPNFPLILGSPVVLDVSQQRNVLAFS